MTRPDQSMNPWRYLAVLLVGAFLALLGTTSVIVALPSIQLSLDATPSALQWVLSGYALAFGLALIPSGRLGDRIGHQRTYALGLGLFTLASLVSGFTQEPGQLIASQVVQGLAAGTFFPAVPALIQVLLGGRQRGRAFALFGAVIGLSTALGPLVGGLLIKAGGAQDGWRWAFLVNVPIGVVALALAARLPRLPRPPTAVRHDWPGLALLTAGLVLLLVPLVEGRRLDWPMWTFASLVAGAVLLAGLVVWERRVQRAGGDPLIAPRLFGSPAFTAGSLLALVYFAAFTSVFFTLSILWQTGLGHGALAAGLLVLPFAAGSFVGASVSHRFSARLGRGVLVLGCGMVLVGFATMVLLLQLTAPDPRAGELLVPLAVAGLGNGLFISPNTDFVLAAVAPGDAGVASGVLNTSQRVGNAIGIAVIGTVLFGTLRVTGPDVAAAFVRSATIATWVNVVLVAAALSLVFALPRRLGGSSTVSQ